MNSASDDSALKQALFGRWIGSSRGETCDYTFHPKNYFTLTITPITEPVSKIYGYWDIRNHALHMGTSESETECAPLTVAENTFSLLMPGGLRTDFRRQLA